MLIILGTGLSLGMAYLIWVVSNKMRPRIPGGTSSFTGTPRDASFIFAILGMVMVFGVASLSTGLWLVAVGRPNRLLSGAVLVLGLILVALAVMFQFQ